MGLKIESNIQSQPIVPREIGAVHGSMTRNRTSPFPRNVLRRAVASSRDRRTTMHWEASVKKMVFHRESRKTGSAHAAAKFRRPTILREGSPVVASLRLYRTARTKGTPIIATI